MARLRSRIILIAKLMIGLGFAALTFLLIWGHHNFNRLPPIAEGTAIDPVVVSVRPGASVITIAGVLAEADVIEHPRLFAWGTRLTGTATMLQAGEYEFAPPISMRDVLAKIVTGQVKQHQITIPEGITTRAAIALISGEERLAGEITVVADEGTLLPETYSFVRGADRQVLVDRMLAGQSDLLQRLWTRYAETRTLATPNAVLTLASIVERETALAAERPHIAGVFLNRLRLGMKLQSDPTVRYALYLDGQMDQASTRPLRRSELSFSHPYNTYTQAGLPPGPIANPGAASIEAVLAPMPTQDLYFVADGTGGHAFAESLQEHERNVRNWRAIERAND